MPTQKTTLYMNSADYQRLKGLAYSRGCAPAFLVREAVAEYVTRHAPPRRPMSVGMGDSGLGDLASRADHYLAGLGEDLIEPSTPRVPVRRRRGR